MRIGICLISSLDIYGFISFKETLQDVQHKFAFNNCTKYLLLPKTTISIAIVKIGLKNVLNHGSKICFGIMKEMQACRDYNL